jgi:hypothetical protein
MTLFLIDTLKLSLDPKYFNGYSPLFYLLKSFDSELASSHSVKYVNDGFFVQDSYGLLPELLKRNVSVDNVDKNGKSLLMMCILYCQPQFVKSLVSSPVSLGIFSEISANKRPTFTKRQTWTKRSSYFIFYFTHTRCHLCRRSQKSKHFRKRDQVPWSNQRNTIFRLSYSHHRIFITISTIQHQRKRFDGKHTAVISSYQWSPRSRNCNT